MITPVFNLRSVSPTAEAIIGDIMLAQAKREGHGPKRIRNLSEAVKSQPKKMRPNSKTMDVLKQLSKPRSVSETAKIVGIGHKTCNDIIRRLVSNNRAVKFGRQMDNGKSVPMYVSAEHEHKFDRPQTAMEIVLDAIGDGEMTIEEIVIHSDLSLDLVINAINNLRRRSLVQNISDDVRCARYASTT